VAVVLLGGCAQEPMGPTAPVMPASNKSFQSFAEDQAVCKEFARQQVQGQADQANNRMLGTAVIGTVLGAGLGAAIGGGQGAAIGAASGAGLGTAVGAGNAQNTNADIQQRYDVAYEQCMYSRGNQVPGVGQGPTAYQPTTPPPPIQSENVPPPPAPSYVWQSGYWQWNNYQYVWVPGHYTARPTATAQWIPDHWVQYNGGWMFVPGQWQG
jgi:outer membrane lipoprotein SlyB